jgi:hypothetical protein
MIEGSTSLPVCATPRRHANRPAVQMRLLNASWPQVRGAMRIDLSLR